MSPRQDVRTLPLRPAVFHILLALSARDLHGLGIADEVERASDGVMELGPGTLYRSLSEMVDAGLIHAADPPAEGTDPRRKYYRLSASGRRLLVEEAARLRRLVEAARDRKVLPDTP